MEEKNQSNQLETKFIDIRTHKLRIKLIDYPSKYTIILEAGGGEFSDAYQLVQPEVAEKTKTRVMSYDRSGFGKSELGPDVFKALDEVNALKKCLGLQGFNDNFILVGHSYGGLLIQLFVYQYPKLVKGMVLIDPMNVKFVDRFGLDNLNAVTPYFDNPTQNHEKAGNRMVDYFSEGLDLLRGKDIPKSIPIRLITAGKFPVASEIWRECHEEMVQNSENHQLVVAEGCSHLIISENPNLVINTITELVQCLNKEE
jgi:pimeloyl-ACP methyl ester carboxylesterase